MEHHIKTPIQKEEIQKLELGDTVYISGNIFTARDAAHTKMLELHEKKEPIPFNPGEMAMFHCGPLVKKIDGSYTVISAGPTTSARLTSIEPPFMRAFGTKVVIGKGGMGTKTVDAMKELGAVYLSYPGGVGALAAERITNVEDVYWLDELGMPEAVWLLNVERFGPMIVGITKGKSLYDEVEKEVKKRMAKIQK